ncbi:hypothetical protein CHS0354_017725 [Potamilus streckersoni]|uniref:Uncharacterized protein n=1 Tax=Potamilus streckersoni TaxID=2493646 RepID=A0AAE0VW79_9BIVA|nr:hypothetical protein CHS0354_017725 [Potamilus streckersoni]
MILIADKSTEVLVSGSGNITFPAGTLVYGTQNSTTPPILRPLIYWSLSRSSLLSILLNLQQEAETLADTAKNTYDHIIHSVIVNDVRKRRTIEEHDEAYN